MARKPEKAAQVVPLKVRKCPICGKPAALAFQPFCSGRCADLDLGRWLNEEYRVPTNEAPGELSDEASSGDGDDVPPPAGGGRQDPF